MRPSDGPRSQLLSLPPRTGRRPATEERDLAHVVPGVPTGSAAWWAEVASARTPLWFPDGLPAADDPPAAGEGARSGVPTLLFLHRHDPHRHDPGAPGAGVYLDLAGLTDRADLTAGAMTHVPGTDVHVAAFGVPDGYVGSYAFVPHDGGLRSPAARNTPQARAWWLGVLAGSRPDALARADGLVDSRGSARSVAVAPPDADPGTAPRASAPAGRTTPRTWHRPDGVDQPVWVRTPARAPGGEVGLLVLFDGAMWADRVPIGPVLDDLHARGLVPPTAAVLVDALSTDRRAADLARTDAYLDLVADDLLPRVVEPVLAGLGLRSHPDPARHVVAGQSYGGLAAFRLAARRPERFGACVSQSGSFWWPAMDDPAQRAVAAHLRTAPARATRTVLQVGRLEGELTDANREVAALLRRRGEHLDYTEVTGGHDWAWWSRHLGAGLVAALG